LKREESRCCQRYEVDLEVKRRTKGGERAILRKERRGGLTSASVFRLLTFPFVLQLQFYIGIIILDVCLFIVALLLNIPIHEVKALLSRYPRLLRFTRQTNTMASSSEDDPMDPAEDVEDDLFGDEDDGPTIKARELSDRELDSGDDEDRDDRIHRAAEVDDDSGRDARIMESTIWRHPLPKPFDGEVRFIFHQAVYIH
jgi:hypothetical protein